MRIDGKPGTALLIASGLVSVLLAAFFGFVGYNKAFAPLSDLARYGSWTVHIPETLGRAVGWSEIACAVALLAGLAWRAVGRTAAVILVLNQICAAAVHATDGEAHALPQNLVLIALLVLVAAVPAPRPDSPVPQGATS